MRDESDSGCHSAGKSSSPSPTAGAACSARRGSCSSSFRVRAALIVSVSASRVSGRSERAEMTACQRIAAAAARRP